MKELLKNITSAMRTDNGRILLDAILAGCSNDPTKPMPDLQNHKTLRAILERLPLEDRASFLTKIDMVLKARAELAHSSPPLTFSSSLSSTSVPQGPDASVDKLDQRQIPKPPLS